MPVDTKEIKLNILKQKENDLMEPITKLKQEISEIEKEILQKQSALEIEEILHKKVGDYEEKIVQDDVKRTRNFITALIKEIKNKEKQLGALETKNMPMLEAIKETLKEIEL